MEPIVVGTLCKGSQNIDHCPVGVRTLTHFEAKKMSDKNVVVSPPPEDKKRGHAKVPMKTNEERSGNDMLSLKLETSWGMCRRLPANGGGSIV